MTGCTARLSGDMVSHRKTAARPAVATATEIPYASVLRGAFRIARTVERASRTVAPRRVQTKVIQSATGFPSLPWVSSPARKP